MPDKQRYTPQQIIGALEQTRGLVFQAAKLLNCTPETINNYCKRYPAVQAVRDACREALVDLAEQKLYESVQRGEAWGVSLVLKTLGRDRGYQEPQTKVEGTVMHEHIHVWKERLQAAHTALEERRSKTHEAEYRALPASRNGLAALPEGQSKAPVDDATD